MRSENNPCIDIFQELVDKKSITISKILEESNSCHYFQAKSPDKILYHPDMRDLHRNSIRFCLLHEENHNRHPYQTSILFVFIAAVFLTLFFISVTSLNLITLIILVILITVLGICLKRREEYQCDEFAATTIKNNFSIEEKPSDILKMTLKLMPYSMMSAIIHPSHKNRIKNIAKRYD